MGPSMDWIASQLTFFGLNCAQMAPGGAESDFDQIFLIFSVCDPLDLTCLADITYPNITTNAWYMCMSLNFDCEAGYCNQLGF